MSDGTLLSDQAFEEWYNSLTKYSIRYDTALAGWQACAQRIRENRWAAFSQKELEDLRQLSYRETSMAALYNEIVTEIEKRSTPNRPNPRKGASQRHAHKAPWWQRFYLLIWYNLLGFWLSKETGLPPAFTLFTFCLQ